jgi:hypothetical protein
MNQVLEEKPPIPAGDSSEVAAAVMPQSITRTVLGTVSYMSCGTSQDKTREIDRRFHIKAAAGSLLDMTV